MKMKKVMMMLILGLILAFNLESARATSLKDTPRLAILPYEDKASKSIGLRLEDATIVSEFLMEQFLDSGRFKIVEREKMKEILAEHSLNASGLVDPLTAVAVGKLAGAQYLVAGSITGLSTKKSGFTGSGAVARSDSETSRNTSIGGGFNKYTVIANITLRIIDLEDGTVVMAVSGTGESARTNVDFSLRKEVVNYFGENGEEDETKTDETNMDETKTDETNMDETKTDETNMDETKTDETNMDETKTDETKTDETNMDETKTDETNMDETKTDETNMDETKTDEVDIPIDASEEDAYLSAEEESMEGYYVEGEGGGVSDTKIVEYRITIGGQGYSMVQVRNALYKATVDAIYNKDYGLLAKLDGTAKRRKV
ncbi:MAG: hypothetical protein IKZ58_05415 [Selenomonadaceae bacterium]|nr:hypothetical protein [Selenomonadaceae bacterium]